ncbi:MAG: ribonuclease R [Verrucomicrobiales bacterium]|nr:ribonuclease R [Verrucomicrobiales bacterium]
MSKQLTKRILAEISRPGYRPANKSELARSLAVSAKERAAFRNALRQLESSGKIVLGKKSRYRKPNAASGKSAPALGKIEFHPDEKRRSARFIPDEPDAFPELKNERWQEIFVPGRNTANAMHGDRVAVRVTKKGEQRWKKKQGNNRRSRPPELEGKDSLEGRVVEVIERANTRIVGTYHARGKNAALAPENSRLPQSFKLSQVLKGAKSGDTVIAEFERWDSTDLPPLAKMVEIVGSPGQTGLDILKIIHSHNLPLDFPNRVLDEAEAIDEAIANEEIARREDWRDREVFTIDPEDAKDFDDAISVVENKDGSFELGVHIADVSHFVKPGSALDKEAKKRGNSVYLADRVIPMLPEKLSNGVCSLKPDVDRLTHCTVIQFAADGTPKKARFCSAVIRSKRRYTYEEAIVLLRMNKQEIDGLKKPEQGLARHIQRAWKLASMLRKRRFDAGGLDLDFPEIRVRLDKQTGKPIELVRSEYDESHQLIEEFMLAANEAVARETKNAQAPSVYRIHEDPDPEKLHDFAEQARAYGHKVHDVTIRAELQKVLKKIRGTNEEHALKIALLKSLKRAAYSPDPIGHYGLAKVNYTHFTSPIRRYADLIVHRVLRKLCHRRNPDHGPEPDPTPSQGALAPVCKHISETERVAADAENESRQMKLVEYLLILANERPDHGFDAIIFEVRPMGAFVELPEFQLKGLIRREDLGEGDWRIDRGGMRFKSGNRSIGVGQTVRVKVIRVDHSRGFVDFAVVED